MTDKDREAFEVEMKFIGYVIKVLIGSALLTISIVYLLTRIFS